MIFSTRIYLNQNFEIIIKIVTALYLALDLFLISKNIKIEEYNVDFKNYSEFKTVERARESIIGGLNIVMLVFLFMN